MTREKRKQLSLLLDEYYNELSKTCNYDCYNCELGILESFGFSDWHTWVIWGANVGFHVL